MSDPRRFKSPEERQAFDEALLRLAADDLPYITFTVSGRPVMIVSDDLDRKAGAILAAMSAGTSVVTYSEYLRSVSESN